MKSLRIQALLLLLVPLMPYSRLSAAPDLGESFDYTLRFRGIVTGFVELDIAQLNLSVGPALERMAGRSAYATRLQLTTESFKKAELIYPVRLDYRCWLDQRSLQPLMAAKSLELSKSRREIFWFDWDEDQGYHYQTVKADDAEQGQPLPERLLQMAVLSDEDWSGLRENQRISLDQGKIIDYMSLLYQLRSLPAELDQWFEFTVYSGKRLMRYRVHVDKERLIRRGWDRDTLHLKLFQYDMERDKIKDEIHVWLSDDEQRLMLRFYAERTIGALEGILETGRPEYSDKEGLPESTRRSLESYLDF